MDFVIEMTQHFAFSVTPYLLILPWVRSLKRHSSSWKDFFNNSVIHTRSSSIMIVLINVPQMSVVHCNGGNAPQTLHLQKTKKYFLDESEKLSNIIASQQGWKQDETDLVYIFRVSVLCCPLLAENVSSCCCICCKSCYTTQCQILMGEVSF